MKNVYSAGLVVALALVGCGGGGGGGGPITVGTPVMGSIGFGTPESTIPGRSGTSMYRRDLYTVSLTAGMPVTILMCSTGSNTFDTYVSIHGPAGAMDNVQTDDDSGSGLNSRLVYTPMTTGSHTLYATTFRTFASGDAAGNYTLTVFAGDVSATQDCP